MTLFTDIGLSHFLLAATALITAGLVQVILHRHGVLAWMGGLLMTLGTVLLWASFSSYGRGLWTGEVVGVFLLLTAIVQTAVVLTFYYRLFRRRENLHLDEMNQLRD